jgi:hypothetical protein
MLVLLSGYNGYSGYRSICRRSGVQTKWDFTVALVALALGFSYILWLQSHDQNWSMPVIYSAVGALAIVTLYDLLKYAWLHRYVREWWLYEHIYKMISAFSATLSAFTGTVLPAFKPYSQLGPSVFCIALIIVMICKRVLRARGRMQSKGLA